MQYSEANTQLFSQMFVWQLYPNQLSETVIVEGFSL